MTPVPTEKTTKPRMFIPSVLPGIGTVSPKGQNTAVRPFCFQNKKGAEHVTVTGKPTHFQWRYHHLMFSSQNKLLHTEDM